MKFWLTYWFSYTYFSYLAKTSSEPQAKASSFIEAFTFIMEMKDKVQLRLSLRRLSFIYDRVESSDALKKASKQPNVKLNDELNNSVELVSKCMIPRVEDKSSGSNPS